MPPLGQHCISPHAIQYIVHLDKAHYDPELRKRNVTAMAHGSKLDASVWEEFSSNWEDLSYQARCILAGLISHTFILRKNAAVSACKPF